MDPHPSCRYIVDTFSAMPASLEYRLVYTYRCHTTHINRFVAIASCQDCYTNTMEATIKWYFLDLAKMLKKGTVYLSKRTMVQSFNVPWLVVGIYGMLVLSSKGVSSTLLNT
ncbi:hypothetical protein K469DRAFT_715715 [Zopfia rhizophila CBS 207.26]|uniref:Uncharacterized protein n=1 Tax=Zopfia rhizophila CBS 207.26 TaxID=1314779 RepID=A0A6A6DKP8_9PEZI|nr:hypothetical protein K469DRAFT_715715 [Zopfia rhizophila CBS 207.26]